ncbi:MAG: leucyl aminopeptidase, partial [Saprospiraceae bacterium]
SWAKASGSTHGYDVTVLDTAQLESLGMGSLLAVGKAAVTQSHMLVMEYKHRAAIGDKIALVGKGVTFDTGGLSIKGSTNMHYMKSDMGGAAAVLGAIETVAKNQLKRHVIGVVPLAENVIASNAVIPGDIITTYSGKTIEVIDTDAEGRMILADALFYTQEQFNPDIMIDLATLTGSAVRTFGYHCGAIFSKNSALLEKLQTIGTTYGERLWPLPIWDEYQEDLYSDVADLRNLGTLPMAGAITAAKFLENFTNEHPAWTHLDIAGVAFGNTPSSKQKAGTGFGVKLLFEFIRAI